MLVPSPSVAGRVTLRRSGTNLLLAGAIWEILSGSDRDQLWLVVVRVQSPTVYAGDYRAFWFPHAPSPTQWIRVQGYPVMMRHACFPRP